MATECKKFALFACCLMTMQALRLVISTAGFCVVRFHIDCELFNIFISRLVNAVLMSQLFGNWLGDLIVFAAGGPLKIYALTLANWVEFLCFCTALGCLCAGEQGKLTGFYWSMVIAYFWWKAGEAPAISIGVDEVDWYFAGFTLSGVWAAMLKALVMIWCVEEKGIHSDVLGDVNVTVVGARSVKTTVDYRAAKWLFIVVIVVTALMCLVWESAQGVRAIDAKWVWAQLAQAETADSKLLTKIKGLSNQKVKKTGSDGQAVNWSDANLGHQKQEVENTITIKVTKGDVSSDAKDVESTGATKTTCDTLKDALQKEFTKGTIDDVALTGKHKDQDNFELTFTLKVATEGWILEGDIRAMAVRTGVITGGIMAVPGAMLFVSLAKLFKKTVTASTLRRWAIVGGVFGAALTAATFGGYVGWRNEGEKWLPHFKWGDKASEGTTWAAMGGLAVGLVVGLVVGVIVAFCKPRLGGSPLPAGAFIGGFVGLWTGEIVNGVQTWNPSFVVNGAAKGWEKEVVSWGYFIVVIGLGTVYSIYPGMAPCSITQFKYFNIIDICILALSSIGPIVIMGLDLAEYPWRLGKVITEKSDGTATGLLWAAVGSAVLMTIGTVICEGIVLDVMQHPFSKTAQKVTTSGLRACTLTILMVSFQLTSTGIGFGCVAAGSGFNDGIYNALSTAVLWTMECCGVLGEGYLTELKKYEPGKWPTQGMGKWDTYWWWNGKAFGNAWKIWCCIGTTDLRRDIMLCRK